MVGATDPCTRTHTPRAVAHVLEHIGEGFVAVDASWRFTYVNAQAERIYRRPRELLLGQELWAMFPMTLGTVFEHEYRRLMVERVDGRVEAPFAPLGAWLEVKVYPLEDGGLAFYFSDIAPRHCAAIHMACQKKLQELIFAGASYESCLRVLAEGMESVAIQGTCASFMIVGDAVRPRHCVSPSLPDAFVAAMECIGSDEFSPLVAAIGTRRTVVIDSIAEHPSPAFRDLARTHGLRAAWITPILSPQGIALGTFSLYFRDCVRPLPLEEESAHLFANLAALLLSHPPANLPAATTRGGGTG